MTTSHTPWLVRLVAGAQLQAADAALQRETDAHAALSEQLRAAQQRRREKAKGGDVSADGPSAASVAPPPVAAGGGRTFVEGYQPTPEYPTAEARRAANARAGELACELEAITGQSSMRVMAHAADYNGAQRMQTRADTMSAPLLNS